MSPKPGRRRFARHLLFLFVAALILAGALTTIVWRHRRTNAVAQNPKGAAPQGANAPGNAVPNFTGTTTAPARTPAAGTASSVSVPVADGKDIASIRQWAHNELEVQRMLSENDRIYRRQLVTLKETAAGVVEQHRLTGEPIRELALAGLDGSEISFEVTAQDLEPSGLRGNFRGHVAGRPDSMVTLAFLQGREAYTIISPSDHLYLDVEPHNPGDVIVKSINLDKYNAWVCGNQ